MTIRMLFLVAALYDGLLGLAFTFAPLAIFERFEVTPPNHVGYVQFPALLLIIFAIMFAVIAVNPVGRRMLIPYGMLLKLAYAGLVFYHWAATDVPDMWKPFAVADLLFLVAFAAAFLTLRRKARGAR